MRNFFLSLAFLFLSISISAQYVVKGLVLSTTTYSAVVNSTITLSREDGAFVQKAYTDKSGYFLLSNVASGKFKLTAYAIGYKQEVRNLEISQNKLDIIIELKPFQIVNDEVLVESIKNKKPFLATHTNLSVDQVKKLNYAQDLPVILSTTPSAVYTSDAGAGVGYTGLRIRGVDATRVNVTINGVPLNDPESHSVYWVDLPDLAGHVNSIQVQRGVGSSTNGGAAFGSSINIETAKNSMEPYTQYTAAFGSFNTIRDNLKFGTGILKNNWSCEGSLSMLKSDGYIERAKSNLRSGYGTIAHYGVKSLLKFIIMHGAESTYQAWDGVPEDSLKVHRTFNGFTYKNQTDNYSQTHYQLLYSHAINSKMNLNTVLHYTKGKGYYESYYGDATLLDYSMPNIISADSSVRTNADLIARKWLDNDFLGVVSSVIFKQKKYEIDGGLSYNNYVGLHFNEVVWSDVWTAPKPNATFEPLRYYNDKGTKNDGNLFGKIFYHYSKHVNLFADMQLRLLNYNFNNANDSNMTNQYQFFNPKLGLDFNFSDSSNMIVYFGRSAHEPTRDEFVQSTSVSLPKVEFLNDIEVGYSKKHKDWTFIANFYNMSYTDQLVSTGKLNDVGNPVRENVKSSYRRGLEIIIQHTFETGFSVNANVTYSKNRINNYFEYVYNASYDSFSVINYKSTPISFSPDVIFGSSIKYATHKNFEFELISKYVSKQFLDNSGSDDRKLNSYFVNDIYLRYHFANQKWVDDLSLSGVIYNVFGTSYESNGYTYGDLTHGIRNSYNYYYPQALQHFALMLQVRF